ncbi:hypothetical protein HMI55_003786 [Coelomomyces lativittatus]|nr:hypothetical protein HMI55_003786 [Coelomomyces lativittatus]
MSWGSQKRLGRLHVTLNYLKSTWPNHDRLLIHLQTKTHNHPTAVSPHPGASTGTGGEIRDEGSVGQGSQSRAGLTGFTVNALCLPNFIQPWEQPLLHPDEPSFSTKPSSSSSSNASSLDIMLQAPLGSASFGNEFGRPNLAGYFRTFTYPFMTTTSSSSSSSSATAAAASSFQPQKWWGYRKPIMLAGGMGQIRPMHLFKQPLVDGSLLIVLGGPCMLIGLGGGAASSMAGGTGSSQLDFSSVQRANPEMQRRCQMVIDHCTGLGEKNPILAIHDVGAGGLSNALPELVHDAHLGATIQLRQILCDDAGLSPMEIWCNESQERYVLGLHPKHLSFFQSICERERCPFAVVGKASSHHHLVVEDSLFNNKVVDVPMDFLFARSPKLHRQDTSSSILYFHF